ncbi:MAG: aminotransferase class III-fold pyridoxal phosphate-dependent enzyme [Candidatus Moduliflexus flocculans]|nr:aminotransferase class III-fold pyridoxal phosphate-dependent enzyme [Candidatus Moduliflexus flocculans]
MNHTTAEILNKYETYFSASHRAVLENRGHAIVEDRREGDCIYDLDGKRYIDCISSLSIHNLGRRPAAIVEELRKAIQETDQGNFPMISEEKATLAEKISRFVPAKLECTVFSVIRGESIDFACKLARGSTGRKELLAVDGSWFGQTGFAMSLSDRKDREIYGPLIPNVGQLPFGDIEAARKMITKTTAAVFIEPVQAENNCRQAGREYLQALRKFCTKKGALLILDETQSGMGRTGKNLPSRKAASSPMCWSLARPWAPACFP